MAPKRQTRIAHTPRKSRASPSASEEATHKARTVGAPTQRRAPHASGDQPPSVAEGTRHPRRARNHTPTPRRAPHASSDQPPSVAEGTRHPRRARSHANLPAGARAGRVGPSEEDDGSRVERSSDRRGMYRSASAVGGTPAGGQRVLGGGVVVGENVFTGSDGGDGDKIDVRVDYGMKGGIGASGSGGGQTEGVRSGPSSAPSAVEGLDVDFARAALSTPTIVGNRPGAAFQHKALAQAAPTLDGGDSSQEGAASARYVNTRERGARRAMVYPRQPESAATTALEAACSRATTSASGAKRYVQESSSLSARDLDQTSLDGIPGNRDVAPEMAVLAARMGQRMRDSLGGFAVSTANVIRSYANSLPKLVAVSACLRAMSPSAVREISWRMLNPSNKDMGFERHLRECEVDGKDMRTTLVEYLGLVYAHWKANGSTRLGRVGQPLHPYAMPVGWRDDHAELWDYAVDTFDVPDSTWVAHPGPRVVGPTILFERPSAIDQVQPTLPRVAAVHMARMDVMRYGADFAPAAASPALAVDAGRRQSRGGLDVGRAEVAHSLAREAAPRVMTEDDTRTRQQRRATFTSPQMDVVPAHGSSRHKAPVLGDKDEDKSPPVSSRLRCFRNYVGSDSVYGQSSLGRVKPAVDVPDYESAEFVSEISSVAPAAGFGRRQSREGLDFDGAEITCDQARNAVPEADVKVRMKWGEGEKEDTPRAFRYAEEKAVGRETGQKGFCVLEGALEEAEESRRCELEIGHYGQLHIDRWC